MVQPPLVLIGPMAAGKSRTGRRLSKILNAPYADTDDIVVDEHGPISEIFEHQGEPTFRQWEREAVAEALRHGGVISLGGGAVLDPQTQAELADCAVVYLSISADAVAERLERKATRPLVADKGVEDWQRIFDERRPLYERLSKIHIDSSHRPMDAIADELAAWYRSRYGGQS